MPSKFALQAAGQVLFRVPRVHADALGTKENDVICLPRPYAAGNYKGALAMLFNRIVREFNKNGKNLVLINIGNKIVRESKDLEYGRKTFGTHAFEFLSSPQTMGRLLKETGKSIGIYEGIKRHDENAGEFYEIGSEYSIGKEDTCYLALKREGILA